MLVKTCGDLRRFTIVAGLLSVVHFAHGKDRNTDYITPPFTLSPDWRYGVLVPVFHDEAATEPDERRNKVIELRTEQVISVLPGNPGYNRRLNFNEVAPTRWSRDSSILLWKVKGKRSPNALALLKIENNRVKWQLDLLTTAQQAVLALTKKVAPEKYIAAKKANTGSGSAFPDGFTINVFTDSEDSPTVSLPLSVHADLSANPKQIEGFPANLDSYLDAVVTDDGRFELAATYDFHLGRRPR